jgi:type IV pilus assembly protein PilO
MADNSLTRLPLAGQLGVSVFLAALICGLFWYFWYSDALELEKTKNARLQQLQKEIRALEVTAAKVQLLEAKLETLKRILPPEKEMPDLMRRVQYLCAQSNLVIRRFTPGAVATKEFYQEVPINIDVEGTFHNLGAFFDRISRLSRLVNMGTIKIAAQGTQTGSNTIAASTVATTYVYVDAPPPSPAPPGARR